VLTRIASASWWLSGSTTTGAGPSAGVAAPSGPVEAQPTSTAAASAPTVAHAIEGRRVRVIGEEGCNVIGGLS
jgi:hypothetical protein